MSNVALQSGMNTLRTLLARLWRWLDDDTHVTEQQRADSDAQADECW